MDFNKLLEQAAKMQSNLESTQTALQNNEYCGSASNGMIEVVLMGDYSLKKININKELLDSENQELVEDMIVIAYNEAKNKLEKDKQAKLADVTGGMNIPGLF